jgi:hypothetical protein
MKLFIRLETIRGNIGLMLKIYSFLPARDRIRLARVDKEFQQDEYRGRVEGIYGSENLSITEAFQEVRDWRMLVGTPWSLYPRYNAPSCWEDTAVGTIRHVDYIGVLERYFDQDEGYDTARMIEELDHDMVDDNIVSQLDYASYCRNEERHNLAKLAAEIDVLPPFPVYNALFDLMEADDTWDTLPFIWACSPNNDERYNMSVFRLEDPPCIHSSSCRYLKNLRPGRRFSFQDANGVLKHKFFKTCQNCGFIKEDTVWEYCKDRTQMMAWRMTR